MERIAEVTRETAETKIRIRINLDGSGCSDIHTGIGFFDHMLKSFARHGFFDLDVQAEGDLEVDCHHTIEDTGIVLGQAIAKALLPMDETLVLTALDLSGRPWLGFEASFLTERVGDFDTQMTKEFFYALCMNCGMNLHIRQICGENSHHIIEAMFKGFAKALDMAVSLDPRIGGVLSTKGSL